jgi:hypothetical protein
LSANQAKTRTNSAGHIAAIMRMARTGNRKRLQIPAGIDVAKNETRYCSGLDNTRRIKPKEFLRN